MIYSRVHTSTTQPPKNPVKDKKALAAMALAQAIVNGEDPALVASAYYGNGGKYPYPPKKDQKDPPKYPAKDNKGKKECAHCKQNHFVWRCDAFEKATLVVRKVTVNREKLCLNCLATGHRRQVCTSKFRCKTCEGKHHSLLHDAEAPVQA